MSRVEDEEVLENIIVSYVLEYFPENCVKVFPTVKSRDGQVRTALVRARIVDHKGSDIRKTKYIEVSSDGSIRRVPSLPHITPIEFFNIDRADEVRISISEHAV